MRYWEELTKFIDEFNEHACMLNPEVDGEFFDMCELEMAKACLHDCPEVAVRVSKIILAVKDIGDIKVKIE